MHSHTCPTCAQKVPMERLVAEESLRIRAWAEKNQHPTHPCDSLRIASAAIYLDYQHPQSLRNAISEKRIDLTPIKIGGKVRIKISDLANTSVARGCNF